MHAIDKLSYHQIDWLTDWLSGRRIVSTLLYLLDKILLFEKFSEYNFTSFEKTFPIKISSFVMLNWTLTLHFNWQRNIPIYNIQHTKFNMQHCLTHNCIHWQTVWLSRSNSLMTNFIGICYSRHIPSNRSIFASMAYHVSKSQGQRWANQHKKKF